MLYLKVHKFVCANLLMLYSTVLHCFILENSILLESEDQTDSIFKIDFFDVRQSNKLPDFN